MTNPLPFFYFKEQKIKDLTDQDLEETFQVNLDESWIPNISTWVSTTEEAQVLLSFSRLILPFHKFVDGRSYSIARLLKGTLHYKGQLLASGEIALDQIPYLYEIGFDGFEVPLSPLYQNIESIQSITTRLKKQPISYLKTH